MNTRQGLNLFLLCALVAGCNRGNPGGELVGRVTIDGAVVRGGDVIVASHDGTIVQIGRIADDGSFKVAEPPVGEVNLAVKTSQFKAFGPAKSEPVSGDPKGHGSGGMIVPSPKELGMTYVWIPEHYEDYQTSGLTLKITRGRMEHDIKLTAK